MVSCSTLVIARKYSDYAVAGLMSVVVIQAFGYGLIFDLNFFLRNLSVIGGLLMVLSDSWVRKTKAFAGLPTLDEKDKKMYFQLAGRVLLIFLFIGFVFSGQWSFWRVLVCILGAGACVMVVVGFKAKYSATLLVVILSGFNLLVNNFWTVSAFATYFLYSLLTNRILYAASRAPPSQGLCQVRFLPDSVHCRWSAAPGQQRPRPVQHRREEEGLLNKTPSKNTSRTKPHVWIRWHVSTVAPRSGTLPQPLGVIFSTIFFGRQGTMGSGFAGYEFYMTKYGWSLRVVASFAHTT